MEKLRVVVLGAGFGGLELSSILSERIGGELDLTLIDRNDSFFFGFSKLDVMFGKKPADAVKHYYSSIVKQGVTFRQETIVSIDPEAKRVVTSGGTYDADVLVVALGADYDISATPGLAEAGNEFYSFAGAVKLAEVIPTFTKGHAIIGVTGGAFKCPPAPSEAALLLHDDLTKRGCRQDCTISIVMPFGVPIPPSPDSSKELLKTFAERDIDFIPHTMVTALDGEQKVAMLDDGRELPYDLFLGIPHHVAPPVVVEAGLVEHGWIPVDRHTLKTKYPNVYAVGDVTSVGGPKAGVFAEGAARVAAESIIADFGNKEHTSSYSGHGICYIEYGEEMIGKVEVDFFSGPSPRGVHTPASVELMKEKESFGESRVAKWFGK